jgi:hypothetical protein
MSSDNYRPSELAEIHSQMAMCEAQAVISEVKDGKIYMRSPYNPALVQLINNTTPKIGKWSKAIGQWIFPVDKEDEVRAIYKKVFGEDGFASTSKVIVSVDVTRAKAAGIPFEKSNKSIWFLGRQIAVTWDFKTTPKPSKGVTVVEGGFIAGGTNSKPTSDFLPNTKFVVDEVPEDLFDALLDMTTSGDHGLKVIGSVPSATMQSAASANSTSSTSSSGGSATTTSPNQAQPAQSVAAKATEPTYADLPKSGKIKVMAAQSLIKAMALRASQLPKDQAEIILGRVGLKFKA